jgi:Protein of unknown function (DUF3987)
MEFTAETESPACYHFWVGCSLISAVTKRQVCLNFNMFKIFPNVYVILVGPSGARKSIATGIGMALAEKAGIKKFSDKITGAALIRDLSNATEKRIEEDGEGHTIELCSPIMIYASELGVFLGHDAYGSGVIADLTDLYDCPTKWEKKTISRDAETVVGPYVSLLAASTPQTLKDTVPTGAVGQGFTSRILFVWGSGRRKRVPIPTWSVGHEMLQSNLIADLSHIGTLRGTFQFDDEGFKAYKKHYMEHPEPEEEYDDERLRGYASRKDIHTLKLAQICSMADNDSLILTKADIDKAIDAVGWLDEGLPEIFAGHGAASNSQDVIRIFKQVEIASLRFGFITYPDLLKRNYSHVNIPEFTAVIQTLTDTNAISETVGKDPKSGKLTKMYRMEDPEFVRKWKGKMPNTLEEKD